MAAASPAASPNGDWLGVLAEAAAEKQTGVSPAAGKTVKSRRSGVTLAEANRDAAKEKLDKKLGQHTKLLESFGGMPAAGTKRSSDVDASAQKIIKLRENLKNAEQALVKAHATQAKKDEASKAAAEKALLAAEKTANYSQEGLIFLVETKFKWEKTFRNTKDKVVNGFFTRLDSLIQSKFGI